MNGARQELARTTLSVMFIAALMAGSAWVLRPFLGAFVWATTIVVATWPLLLGVERGLGGRRWLAVVAMVCLLLAILILPVSLAVRAIVVHGDVLAARASLLSNLQFPPPPAWVAGIPLIGAKAAAKWQELSSAAPGELAAKLEPYARTIASWFAQRAGGIAGMVLQFLLTTVFAGVLYAGGEAWARWARKFGRRLAGERGDRVVVLAGQAIRGVALGVVVTALLQTLLGALGLYVAGVPFASVLTAIMFILCIAQLGPLLVLIAATAWVYLHAGPAWGTVMLVYSGVVGIMDNIVRPVLIRRGADLPLLLIFTGVVGGLVAFGVVGLFVGPVLLAVTYTLLSDWVQESGDVESNRVAVEASTE